jgi:hypothetical protein
MQMPYASAVFDSPGHRPKMMRQGWDIRATWPAIESWPISLSVFSDAKQNSALWVYDHF